MVFVFNHKKPIKGFIVIVFLILLLQSPADLSATDPELAITHEDRITSEIAPSSQISEDDTDSLSDLLDLSAIDDEASFLASIPISSTGSLISRKGGEDPCNVIVITSEEIKNIQQVSAKLRLKLLNEKEELIKKNQKEVKEQGIILKQPHYYLIFCAQ